MADDDFTFRRGTIQVGSAGSLELTGAVDMEFREIPINESLAIQGGIMASGKVTINGSTWSEMRLSSSATWGTWAGIQLSGSGTRVRNTDRSRLDKRSGFRATGGASMRT